MVPFWFFLGPYAPKYCSVLLKSFEGGGGRGAGGALIAHIVYKRPIPLYVLDAKFPFLCICCSQLYLKKTMYYFGSGPNWDHSTGEEGGVGAHDVGQ